jgi:uncharacterized protein (DUF2235 family)
MSRKLVVLYDGTWNTTEDRTSVIRLAELIAAQSSDGAEQLVFYDKGVGTHALDRVIGGTFGYGLSDNIRDGYGWLAGNFRPGDELFCFGFSRGAYTARSLVGLIRKCGILRPPGMAEVPEAQEQSSGRPRARVSSTRPTTCTARKTFVPTTPRPRRFAPASLSNWRRASNSSACGTRSAASVCR